MLRCCWVRRRSTSTYHAGRLGGMRRVFAWNVTAQPRGGEDLARVEARLGIKRATQPVHALEVALRKHFAHIGGFVSAHAVLTCNGSARADAQAHDLSR